MLLQLHITARSPLAFAQTKPGAQFRESLPYVPGATIYGALGRLLEQQGAFKADLVEQLRCQR
jgi:CRISPR-associated protein Csx10